MKKRTLKKAFAATVAAMMVMSVPVYAEEGGALTIDQIKLGEDYTDITADLKFLTHKTDIVDSVFQGYVEEFQKLYPNVNIEYVPGICKRGSSLPQCKRNKNVSL